MASKGKGAAKAIVDLLEAGGNARTDSDSPAPTGLPTVRPQT